MFTPGKIAFAIFFVISFTVLMILAYGKDKKNHKRYYKNASKKVILYGLLVVVLFVAFRLLTSG